jgi:hypothetical protein
MILKNPDDYEFMRFQKSTSRNKKYDALMRNKITNKIKKISFGELPYQHYEDKTDLNLYSHLNHYDKKRRSNYIARHMKNIINKYSSGWFAYNYLW